MCGSYIRYICMTLYALTNFKDDTIKGKTLHSTGLRDQQTQLFIVQPYRPTPGKLWYKISIVTFPMNMA